jgi:C4-dicarboxylate-specific signal transduction histidine kinase
MSMKEISLHILDIVQNSITAEASLIEMTVDENPSRDTLTVTIKDDGCGMDQQLLCSVTSPFVTTRTTRKIGLGIPMFKVGAESSGGSFSIESKVGGDDHHRYL